MANNKPFMHARASSQNQPSRRLEADTDARQRVPLLDVLRGVALLWMTAFHFCFDLSYLGLWRQDSYGSAVWTAQRTAILSLFLFCAGVSQALALAQVQPLRRFFKRWLQIAGCALLVSLGSWWMFPQSFIYFGVLHAMAVMLLIARGTARWGRWLWVAGLAVAVMPYAAPLLHSASSSWEVLNSPSWNWLGLISRKPRTEDYVPLLPWLGVVWWGLAAGQWLVQRRPGGLWHAPLPLGLRWVAAIGRWPLSWYMLHQLVLLGTLMGYLTLKAYVGR